MKEKVFIGRFEDAYDHIVNIVIVKATTKSEALGLILESDSSTTKWDWEVNELELEYGIVYDEFGEDITSDRGV